MTALAGFWRTGGAGAQESSARVPCARILAAQSIYGSGEEASWSGPGLCFARKITRLFAEDRADRGPIVRGEAALVADLRLDNRDELAAALGLAAPGALCDADILMSALAAWGLDALQRIHGDFAFAWWDGRRLVLARDFLGQRPLHYHAGEGFFAFASMGKGLHALPQVPYRPDVARAADFLALLPERGPGTFFEGISRVEPGHLLIVEAGQPPSLVPGVRSQRWWRPDLEPFAGRTLDDTVEEMRHRLDVAVSRRLRGADAFAAQLSAGLDSNAVAATAARLLGAKGGRGGRVTAFTSVPRPGYDQAAPLGLIGDEGPLAALTASLYPNMDHVRISGADRSPAAALDRNFFLYERPILSLSNGTWWDAINDEAKSRKLTVMLTGQAGNLSLSYTGYELLPQLFARGRWFALAGLARRMRAHGTPLSFVAQLAAGPFVPAGAWKRLARWVGKDRDAFFRDRGFARERLPALLARAEALGVDTSFRPRRDPVRGRLDALNASDLGNFNKGMLAGWGIDYRDPTADRELVEFCLRVPLSHYLADGRPRTLALRALADRVHPDVLAEKRKGYQAVDWHEGFEAGRGEIQGEIERLGECAPAAEVIDLGELRALIANPPEPEDDKVVVMRRHRGALLRGLSIGHFLRRASGSNR